MTGQGVREALVEYESLLRERGALVVSNLQPGASDEHIAEMEEKYGFRLTQDARAVWAWHNGTFIDDWTDSSTALKPGCPFYDLDRSLARGRHIAEMDIEAFGEDSEYLGRKLVILDFYSLGDAIDCADHNEETSMVIPLYSDSPIHESGAIVTVEEKIRWWIWAINQGAWIVKDDGTWAADLAKYPKGRQLKDVL